MKCFVYLGEGNHRIGFQHGRYVVKVPLNESGLHDNQKEYDRWKDYRKHYFSGKMQSRPVVKLARCRLLFNYFLVMELVRPCLWKEQPRWARRIDCGQVGFNCNNIVVAYDYA